jgi:hypothetical protein
MIMDSRKWNLNALVVVALVAGLIQVAAGVVMYLAGFYFSPWSMLVTGIVLLACIVFGTSWYRNKHTGEFGYVQAFLTGVAIGVGTGIVYAIYNLISINFFYPNFLDEVARAYASTGAFPYETIRASLSPMSIAIPNLIRLSVLGIIMAAIAAVFLRRSGPA